MSCAVQIPSSSSSFPKSFAEAIGKLQNVAISQSTAGQHKGEPAVFFSPDDIAKLSIPFQFALVGKFSHGRPSLDEIRSVFASIGLKAAIYIGLLDHKHVLLRFHCEEDFLRVWLKEVWYLKRYPMRVFKWTKDFRVDVEAAIAPVWVSFPQLPVYFFAKQSLFAIACMVGRPLCLDNATTQLTRPSVARINVEVNLLQKLPSRIWVGTGEGGFWQAVDYEAVPWYCSRCFRQGHDKESCKLGTDASNTDINDTLVQGTPGARGNAVALSIEDPVENVLNIGDTSMIISTHNQTPSISNANAIHCSKGSDDEQIDRRTEFREGKVCMMARSDLADKYGTGSSNSKKVEKDDGIVGSIEIQPNQYSIGIQASNGVIKRGETNLKESDEFNAEGIKADIEGGGGGGGGGEEEEENYDGDEEDNEEEEGEEEGREGSDDEDDKIESNVNFDLLVECKKILTTEITRVSPNCVPNYSIANSPKKVKVVGQQMDKGHMVEVMKVMKGNASKCSIVMKDRTREVIDNISTPSNNMFAALAFDENLDTSLERNQSIKDDSFKRDQPASGEKSLAYTTEFGVVKHKFDQVDQFLLDQLSNVDHIRKSGRPKREIHKPIRYK